MYRVHRSRCFRLLSRLEVVWGAIALVCVGIALVSFQVSGAQHDICVQTQASRAVLYDLMKRSLKTLPRNPFYANLDKLDPATRYERLRQLRYSIAQTKRTIPKFKPTSC